MTKNGAPSTDSSSSYQCTGGSGTAVCSDSALITLYCESKSASRKIVCAVGFTRITYPAARASLPAGPRLAPPGTGPSEEVAVARKAGEAGPRQLRELRGVPTRALARPAGGADDPGLRGVALLGDRHGYSKAQSSKPQSLT